MTSFTLLSQRGRGAMGVVWRARDEESGEIVALKLLREAYADDPDYLARFGRELELARRVDSPNVVKVLGYGVREGTPYLALEYVDGPSLRERLAAHGPFSWAEVKVLLAQVAAGLTAAHGAGIVHRDVKPSNILLGADGTAKLTDFGVARGLDLTRVTGTSALLGTPAYLAPEGPVDARSDLYSLGCVAYELLTGAVPFEGPSYQAVILAHVRTPPDLSRLPPEARPLVGALLAKDPADRPASAAQVVGMLEGRPSLAPTARPERPGARSTRASPHHRTRLAAGSLLVGLAALAAVVAIAANGGMGNAGGAAPSGTLSAYVATGPGSPAVAPSLDLGAWASASPTPDSSPALAPTTMSTQTPTSRSPAAPQATITLPAGNGLELVSVSRPSPATAQLTMVFRYSGSPPLPPNNVVVIDVDPAPTPPGCFPAPNGGCYATFSGAEFTIGHAGTFTKTLSETYYGASVGAPASWTTTTIRVHMQVRPHYGPAGAEVLTLDIPLTLRWQAP